MAEENDATERASSYDFAAHLAAHSASSAEADAFLRDQREFIRLQIEDLKREDKLRHWSLRVHHISDLLKLGFELIVGLIVLVIATGLAGAIWQATHADGLVIDSFNVSADMTARGLSGQVVAAKLLDRLTAMQNATSSSRASSSVSRDWTNDIKVEIPDTGVSLGEAMRTLRAWLGHEIRLSGDVTESANGLALTVRLGDAPGTTFMGKPGDLDALTQKAAEAVFAGAQRYRYASYLLGTNSRQAERTAILTDLAHTGDAKDRAWANDALALSARFAGDYAKTRVYAQRAIETDPYFPYPWVVLSNIAMDQGHDADALAKMRTYAALVNTHGVEELGAEQFAFERKQSIALVAHLAGDYRTAVDNFPDPKRQWLRGTAEALSLALEHDPAGARDALAAFRPGHVNQSGAMPTADAAIAQGVIALETGDWHAARDSFERAGALAHEIDVRSHGVYSDRAYREARAAPRLALAYAMLGEKAKALAILQALPLDCDLCGRIRGRVAALGQDWNGAGYWFALVSARSPNIPFADTDWGEMLLRKGDLDGAIAKFTSAHKKSPHFADPLEMGGEALIAKNRSELALAKFEEAAKYAPNWGRLHLKWGEALLWSGDRDGAAKQFAAAATLDLTSAEKAELKKGAHG